MSLVNGFQGQINSAKNFIKNPFSSLVTVPLDGNDFPEGFFIQELLSNGQQGETIRLSGNMMPKIPFTFGGSQRIKKEFYPGYSEPVVQVLGSEEDDITINGEFKDKGYSRDLKGVSSDIQQLIDAIRIRGNIVRISMGEFERYALILRTKFDMEKLSKIPYSITFSIIGFNAPTNARFLQKTREVPLNINRELIAQAEFFNEHNSNIPSTVPFSIADQINRLTADIAGVMATITDFVDNILNAVKDIQKSITRAKGLIKYAQNKLKNYKETIGSFQPFNDSQALTGKYTNAKFYAAGIAAASSLTAILQRLKAQIAAITPTVPLARHLVVDGENLQKISVKFYGTADNWKKIYEYNNLSSTELATGAVLEIPRL